MAKIDWEKVEKATQKMLNSTDGIDLYSFYHQNREIVEEVMKEMEKGYKLGETKCMQCGEQIWEEEQAEPIDVVIDLRKIESGRPQDEIIGQWCSISCMQKWLEKNPDELSGYE